MILILIVIAVIVLIGYSVMAYLGKYYAATATAREAMSGTGDVNVTKTENYYLFTAGGTGKAGEAATEKESQSEGTEKEELTVGTAARGIIFYPGAKVEEAAYAPLACELVEAGYDVYLMCMPFHMAIFKKDAADLVIDAADCTTSWILMGHSLGGSMAASYTAEHTDVIDGLVMLASYSTVDLSDSAVTVLSIYGENDRVLNLSRYEKYRNHLPEDYSEYIIEGGNHAGFGYYGEQKGDGIAGITPREQQNEVVDQVRYVFGEQ